jgi:hypothetical protein
LQFSLQAPSTTNPTGSSCTANVTVGGSAPTALQVLVNGRSVAGPVSTPTLAVPSFTADGPLVLTILQGGTTISSPAIASPIPPATTAPATLLPTVSTTPTSATATTTTTTTTLGVATGPPASGKPEIQAKLSGVIPSTILGIDVIVTCTPVPGSSVFQVYSARVTATGLFIVPATLNQSSSCQIEGLLIGAPNASELYSQVLVRGLRVSGPTLGASINSPAFAASEPFRATVEFSFGPFPATTTPPTSTPLVTTSSAPTTIPGAIGVGGGTTPAGSGLTFAAASGTVPSSDIGYKTRLACTNVVVSGVTQSNYSFESNFTPTGGSTVYSVSGQANSQCQISVSILSTATTPAATGAVQVAVNGSVVTNGTRNATTPSFSVATPFQVRVTVAY